MQETDRPNSSDMSILKLKQEAKEKDESMSNANPVSESTVMQEMLMAERKATDISAEIKELKKILLELLNKEDMTEEDSVQMMDTQTMVLQKIGELNEITHVLLRSLSLCDPNAKKFDKMFQMLRHGLK